MATLESYEALQTLVTLADDLLADWIDGPLDDLVARLSSYSAQRAALFAIVEQNLDPPSERETALIRSVLERDAAIGQRIERARTQSETQRDEIRVRRKGLNGYRAQTKPRSHYLKG